MINETSVDNMIEQKTEEAHLLEQLEIKIKNFIAFLDSIDEENFEN